MYQTLQIEAQDSVAIVTIHRPEVLNALSSKVLIEIDSFLLDTLEDTQVRAIVITGSGTKAFVAGADISEIEGLQGQKPYYFSRRGQSIFRRIETYPKPVVAAINGFALGGGCELALACHLRTASTNAKIGLPEINLGIIPGYGGTQRLARIVGKARATEMILSGVPFSAEQALQMGILNYVYPQEELISKTLEFLSPILSKSAHSISYALSAIHFMENLWEGGYEHEARNFLQVCNSEDGKEGVRAFLEKRKPNFK